MTTHFAPSALIKVMQDRDMNRTELANKLGVSRATVTRVLNGNFRPSAEFLAALKDSFPEISLDYFFREGGA